MSTMRPLAAASSGSYRPSSAAFGGSSNFSFSSTASSGGGFGGGYGFGMGGSGSGGGGFGSSSAFGGGDNIFLGTNEKLTMQNLNDRLAAYLENVHRLEKENARLEQAIRDIYSQAISGTGGPAAHDYSPLQKEIDELQDKVVLCKVGATELLTKIDNAKLAADDFRQKHDSEKCLRMGVEADVNGLMRVHDDLGLAKSELQIQIESLNEELDYLKKNHEEEMNIASSGISGQVNVELDAAPSTNLLEEMDAYRKQCETALEQARLEGDRLFNERAKDIKEKAVESQEALTSHKTEISDLRRGLQALEIEYQSQLARKASLEATLGETESRYGVLIQEIQMKINNLEDQIADIRAQIECQAQDYQMAMDVKQRLEKEIATYRGLLETGDSKLDHQVVVVHSVR